MAPADSGLRQQRLAFASVEANFLEHPRLLLSRKPHVHLQWPLGLPIPILARCKKVLFRPRDVAKGEFARNEILKEVLQHKKRLCTAVVRLHAQNARLDALRGRGQEALRVSVLEGRHDPLASLRFGICGLRAGVQWGAPQCSSNKTSDKDYTHSDSDDLASST